MKLLLIWKYPIYFRQILWKFLPAVILVLKGCKLGRKNIFMGFPIISIKEQSSIEIGNNCLICSHSYYTALGVRGPVILRTLRNKALIKIGNGVRMSGTTICANQHIEIGDDCVIGADCIICDTDFHSLSSSDRKSIKDAELAESSPVKIGTGVFIGARSIILKGVTIGNNAVIGAGSLVAKDVEANAIVAGNPIKMIGSIKQVISIP